MKDLIKILFLAFIFSLVYYYKDQITDFIFDNFIHKNVDFVSTPNNNTINYDFMFVKTADDFTAETKQEILDIFYTALNNGEDNFYFYCAYEDCEKDVNEFTEENTFALINNFVHPYNTYRKIYITVNSWRKINIEIEKAYITNEIKQTDKVLEEIINKIINDKMTDKEKIRTFHDYVINHTKYDSDYIKNGVENTISTSHRASGPLLAGKALCGGYSQAMSLFLNYLNIPNYRISSDTHIWNYVYLDDNWYHLDLTWDDPVTSNNTDILLDKFFLITTDKLNKFNTGSHTFDETVYLETIQSQ